MLEKSVYRRRLDEVEHVLQKNSADFALLTPSPGYQYLTGSAYQMHERLVALLVIPREEPQIIAPSFEVSDHANNTWISKFLPWNENEDPYVILAGAVASKPDGFNVMFDEKLPLGIYWGIKKAIGEFQKTNSLTPHLESMRLIKSQEEIDMMKRAGQIIDKAVMKAFQSAKVGMTEKEVQQIVQNEVATHGASQTFAAVQFGEKTALPHARSGERELREGDMVLMDCGCSIEGYNTDMTRVGVVGEPTTEQEKVHSIVKLAEETALERLKPGIACGAADGIARRIIEEAGYGDEFTHRLGHGIGLEVHEPPYIIRGNAQILEPGMTHSVEPGIYQEGKFGVRIEDLVVITENGAEVLTFSPRELFIIDV
ncbi:MAG: Xaa-Pro peptidase family protein [Candidatus Thorarchaeota archaeon]|nr:Xaa-Pro peptidase family protein [Candidatus Thorarchaeota archaeon]